MLALAGKVLIGLSLGMVSSFVLGATSVGLWTLAWPAIVLTGSVGAAFWLIGKAMESPSSGGSGGPSNPEGNPPAYESDVEITKKVKPEKSERKKANVRDVTPEPSSRPGPSIFVTPPSRPSVFFASQPHATTVRRGPSVVVKPGTPYPQAPASRVEVRLPAARQEVRFSAGGPPLMATGSRVAGGGAGSGATTVRYAGTRSVRVR